MTTRRLLALAAALLTCLGSGCRRQPPPPAPSDREALNVRLAVSPRSPERWARDADRGLARIADELGAAVSRVRVEDASIARSAGSSEVASPPDLVVCLGRDFANPLFTDAALYPSTWFAVLPGRGHPPNVAGVELVSEGAGYVAGVVAAHLRPSDVVGVLRGDGEGWLEDLEGGFVSGFRSVRPGGRVVTAGSVASGASQLVAEGAAVALYATDVPEHQVLTAAREAGLRLIAADDALLEEGPELVAAAVRVDLAEVMVRLAREVQAGTFSAGQYTFDLGSGVLDVRLDPRLPSGQAKELREALELARSVVTAGIVEMEGLGM